MAIQDCLHRFVFEDHPIRGEITQLDATWQAVLTRRDYPPLIQRLLGEAMAATALLSATIKFQGQLTLQLQSQGPLRLLLVQCSNERRLRGLARWEGDMADAPLPVLCAEGSLAITLTLEGAQSPYQGIVAVTEDSLAANLEAYLNRSEQIPSHLHLAADQTRAAGLLLQRLPHQAQDNDDIWNAIEAMSSRLRDAELLRLDTATLVSRLFSHHTLRLFPAQPVAFACSCSRERIVTLLRALGRDEVRDILAEQGKVQVTCEFCGMPYSFDPVDSEGVFAMPVHPPFPDTQH